MELHKKHIENKCKVCGNKPKGYKHNKNSDACQGILSSVFGLDVAAESDEIYPPVVCNSCYLTMRELEKAKQKGAARATNLVLYSWTPHREESCPCSMVSRGGKPVKKKRKLEIKGRPSSENINHAVMSKIAEFNIAPYIDSPLLPTYFLPNSMLDDLICQRCACIPNQSVEVLTCRHFLCAQCILSVCETNTPLYCCTTSPITAHQLSLPSPLVVKLLDSLLVQCKNGCGEIMELKHLKNHLKSNCTTIEIPPPSKITVDNLLNPSVNPLHLKCRPTPWAC